VRLSRRAVLLGGLAAAAGTALPIGLAAAPSGPSLRLRPKPATARFFGADGPETAVWAFNGRVPGPEIRFPQGARLSVRVDNGLSLTPWTGCRT
jgi:FtsP/CotA-like multicopper oxidase with cupredoxin domain